MIVRRDFCNACDGRLHDVFAMGAMPLANRLRAVSESCAPDQVYPLTVAECSECSLVQLRYLVDPDTLYRDYRFFTGASPPNITYFAELAGWIKDRVATGGKRVLEIGSNDGTLLQAMESKGFEVTGVDPATTQCEVAKSRLGPGSTVHCNYWSNANAYQVGQRLFDVVVACNVLGHAVHLRDFLQGAKRVIRTDGLLVIEVQYLKSLLGQGAFELIYHEHVSYFDEHSLAALLSACGFTVLGWEVTDSQCGTLRMWANAWGGGTIPPICQHDWPAFRETIEVRRQSLMRRIQQAHQAGRRVCFYGAPAKATQLANYFRLGTDTIQFATDTTPAKQGLLIPGAMIPVVHPSELQPTDTAIVTAWNFYNQIRECESAFLASGGELICPTAEGSWQ